MLELQDISMVFPRFSLNRVSFTVHSGEYFVVFGPTGSGKTLLFELIVGLQVPCGGDIFVNGRKLTATDPAYRRIGYVPQDLALIPFKTVWQNVAFGLLSPVFRPAGTSRQRAAEVRDRVAEILGLLKIGHLAERLPGHLSGGEKQRVALGRALAVRPSILLLDEPLSAVDEGTGNLLMREIKMLQTSLKITTLHICHRFEEMMYLADRVAILRDGTVEQVGQPQQVRTAPGNAFVAALMRSGSAALDSAPNHSRE